jgi:hypothetical protein
MTAGPSSATVCAAANRVSESESSSFAESRSANEFGIMYSTSAFEVGVRQLDFVGANCECDCEYEK